MILRPATVYTIQMEEKEMEAKNNEKRNNQTKNIKKT